MATTTGTAAKKTYPGGAWPFAALLAGNAALALGPWLVRLADTGAGGCGVLAAGAPPAAVRLAGVSRARRNLRRSAHRLDPARGGGLLRFRTLASWHIGIGLTKLGNATLFGNSGSLILMAWGLVAMRRAPSRAEVLALGAALAGAAILLGRSLEISPRTLGGDLLCVLAGAFYVLYLLPAQAAREWMGQWSVLALVCASGAPGAARDRVGAGRAGPAGCRRMVAGYRPRGDESGRRAGAAGLCAGLFSSAGDRDGAADPARARGDHRVAGVRRDAGLARYSGHGAGRRGAGDRAR